MNSTQTLPPDEEGTSVGQARLPGNSTGTLPVRPRQPAALLGRPLRVTPGAQPERVELYPRPVRWLHRWSLALVVGIAAAVGVLYLHLVPLWQGPDEPAHFAYLALLDKYGLDDRLVQSLDFGQDRRQGDPALVAAIAASMERHNFARFVLGYGAPGSELGPNYPLFEEVRQPAPYYFICAVALRLARLLGIPTDPYRNPDTALLAMRWVSLLMSLGVVILAWLAGALLSSGPWLRLLIPLTVTLFPQHLFMMSMANNDALAELAVSALLVALLALLARPFARSAPALVALSLVLALMSAFTKGSAVAAAFPLLAMGLMAWLGLLIFRWAAHRWRQVTAGRERFAALLLLPLLLAGLAGAAWLAVGPIDDEVANWNMGQADNPPMKRVAASDAHDGAYVMEVPTPGEVYAAVQVIAPPVDHPAMNIDVTGWARLSRLPEGHTPAKLAVAMKLYDGSSLVANVGVAFDAPGVWKPLSLSAPVKEGGGGVTLKLVAFERGVVQFDDVHMQITFPSYAWYVPFFRPELLNGSAEQAAVGVRPPLDRAMPMEGRQILGVLLNPQHYSLPEVWGFYAKEEYRSFWGNFGWLALPLPDGLYLFVGVFAVISLLGLALHGAIRLGRWSVREWVGLMSLLSMALAVVIGFSRQTMLLSLYGNAAYPQGRYLFVLIIPIAWLLLSGFAELWTEGANIGLWLYRLVRKRGSSAEGRKSDVRPSLIWWQLVGAGAWVAMLLVFELYSLLGLIVPHFSG